MKIFGRHWDPLELAFATAGLVLSVTTVLAPAHARLAAAMVLSAVILMLAVHFVVRKARTTYVLPGVHSVVTELTDLARKSTRSVWTARSQVGELEVLDDYYHVLAKRVHEGKIEDFRRVIHLSKARSARVHLHWLIDKFADRPAVKVRYFKSSTALLDVAIFDGRQAVIVFPQTKGEGFQGAMFTRDSLAVKGLESMFQLLEAQGTVLFSGTRHITEEDRQRMKSLIDREIDLLPVDPAFMHGTIEKLINSIIDQRAKGDPAVEKLIKVKLLLKGIDPSKFSGDSADDPTIIDKLNQAVADFEVRL
jgi:hypothetical protein